MKDLPNYMKLCFLALYNTVNGIAYDILKEHEANVIPYLKRAVRTHDYFFYYVQGPFESGFDWNYLLQNCF